MQEVSTSTAIPTNAIKAEALASMSASFERFCLAAGLEALAEMMEQDALAACGERHERGRRRKAHRWGKTKGKIGFHGGKVEMARPRLRGFDGKEQALPSWEAAQSEDWLGKWAMNQMLINVSTRKFQRSMRLPEGGVPAPKGAGLSRSAACPHRRQISTDDIGPRTDAAVHRICARRTHLHQPKGDAVDGASASDPFISISRTRRRSSSDSKATNGGRRPSCCAASWRTSRDHRSNGCAP